MAAQRGRAILLKIGTGASPDVFTAVGGMRSKTITINNQTVDITTDDESPWRTLLSDAGLRSLSMSGSGIFKDDATLNRMEELALNGLFEDFQLVFENGDYFQGPFQVTRFEYAGETSGPQTYALTVESAGPVYLFRAP